MRAPSRSIARAARLVTYERCSTTMAPGFPPDARSRYHVAASLPSTSTVPCTLVARPASPRASSGTNRDRSACDRTALSYSGRKRTGASTSPGGRGASGRSKSFPAALVTEAAQLWAQPFDDFAKAGEVRPRGDVGDGRGTEGPEISQHDVVDAGRGGEWTPDPMFERCRLDLTRTTPEPAWRDLHQRQLVPARVGEGSRVQVGKALAERGAQLRARSGFVLEQAARVREHLVDVDAGERRPEVAMSLQLAVQHRLHQRSELQCVIDGEEMQGRAHRGDANE